MSNCTDCLIDLTDACPRGCGRAIDNEICDSFFSRETYEVNKNESWQLAYQQGRTDAIDEFARPILDGTLHTICRMIASGDIPKDVYQKWLSDTPIGFMTPLEIYSEILNEQLKEQK